MRPAWRPARHPGRFFRRWHPDFLNYGAAQLISLAESNNTNLPVSRRSSRRRPARRRQRNCRRVANHPHEQRSPRRPRPDPAERTDLGPHRSRLRRRHRTCGYILAEGENGEPDLIIIATPWREFVGDAGEIVSLEHFGASASGPELFERFGFTVDRLVHAARTTLARTTTARRAPVTTSL